MWMTYFQNNEKSYLIPVIKYKKCKTFRFILFVDANESWSFPTEVYIQQTANKQRHNEHGRSWIKYFTSIVNFKLSLIPIIWATHLHAQLQTINYSLPRTTQRIPSSHGYANNITSDTYNDDRCISGRSYFSSTQRCSGALVVGRYIVRACHIAYRYLFELCCAVWD